MDGAEANSVRLATLSLPPHPLDVVTVIAPVFFARLRRCTRYWISSEKRTRKQHGA